MIESRPDLTGVSAEVRAYIEALEAELARLTVLTVRPARPPARADEEDIPQEAAPGPAEPPTTLAVITATTGGLIKRTFRHLYGRQSRGGMGVFDLDADGSNRQADPPAFLAIADFNQNLIAVTSQGRAFPLTVRQINEAPVRSRGQALSQWFPFQPGERLALLAVDQGSGYLALVTVRGWVRRLRYHYFGAALKPGTILYDIREGGAPAAACWTPGDGELFIATRKGNAIRFAETQVPVRGCPGIRVDPDDAVVGVAPVRADSRVFLLSADGKGTIRAMSGFSANKEPGSGGKVAMKADRLVGAVAVAPGDDIFVISRLGKIIRFAADETPEKEGVVQGVNCMALRSDETTAVVVSR
jgi:DNA gyrase subunit A